MATKKYFMVECCLPNDQLQIFDTYLGWVTKTNLKPCLMHCCFFRFALKVKVPVSKYRPTYILTPLVNLMVSKLELFS